ncbi:hypothetical protein [Tichowtungia aerotolerans]|uniref:Uncharacterized protein n=1 Tax=Tichowtungia aerotolerans TaxID=2697043 RepID=A0A6P1ME64_9BACT|nr:hypothetical protein [Tichowtungia aerotolerans]QHI70348.1 hypothetical protein GT409_13165 [Tichowtungia aerotolerans]
MRLLYPGEQTERRVRTIADCIPVCLTDLIALVSHELPSGIIRKFR